MIMNWKLLFEDSGCNLAKASCISSSTLTISTSAGSSVQTCWTEEKNCRTYIAMLFRRILHFFITVPASVLSFSGTRVWTSRTNLSILSRTAWKSFAICVWCPTDLRNYQKIVCVCFCACAFKWLLNSNTTNTIQVVFVSYACLWKHQPDKYKCPAWHTAR